jgi:hypothetical protein
MLADSLTFVCDDCDLADIDSEVMTLAVETLAAILRKRGQGERLELVLFDDGSGHVNLVPESLPPSRNGFVVDLDNPSDLAAWVDAEVW